MFYEAPHRVRETVAALAQALGGERMLVVARELTKKFEEIARLPLAEGEAWFDADANRVRGEFVLVVDAPDNAAGEAAQLTPESSAGSRRCLVELPPAAAARVVASVSGVARDLVYERATALKAQPRGRAKGACWGVPGALHPVKSGVAGLGAARPILGVHQADATPHGRSFSMALGFANGRQH